MMWRVMKLIWIYLLTYLLTFFLSYLLTYLFIYLPALNAVQFKPCDESLCYHKKMGKPSSDVNKTKFLRPWPRRYLQDKTKTKTTGSK